MAETILENQPSEDTEIPIRRFGSGFGKPVFLNLKDKKFELVGIDSWLFLCLLDIDTSFLSVPPDQWSTNKEYADGLQKVWAINCTNDWAERGVKLSSDFRICEAQGQSSECHSSG